ncbi:MAG: hypothetical protein M9905_17615 [Rhizobiaceae bacterium]|nr:hypothetical protein [Rhizobiaceae bacterium]
MSDHGLPGILGEIAEVAGKEAAWAIWKTRGGTRIGFPAKPDADHWLVRLLGADVARKICDHFASTSAGGRSSGLHAIVLPLGPDSLLKVARRRVAEEIRSGKSAGEAAREVGVHERTAWRIKAKMKPDDSQGELF